MTPRHVLVLLLALIFIPACSKPTTPAKFTPIHGHYGVAVQAMDIDSGPGAQFFYRDDAGMLTLLWPYLGLRDSKPAFHENIAIILTDFADEKGRLGSYPAYFAADGPGPLLDISDDLLKLWADDNKLDFKSLRPHYMPSSLTEVPTGIQVDYLSDPQVPEAKFTVTWDQIAKIINDVKTAGGRHQSYGENTSFICKDYGPRRAPHRPD